MSDGSQQRPGRTDASGLRELLGLRARRVGDELIDEHDKVIAVTNRQAFRAWRLFRRGLETARTCRCACYRGLRRRLGAIQMNEAREHSFRKKLCPCASRR